MPTCYTSKRLALSCHASQRDKSTDAERLLAKAKAIRDSIPSGSANLMPPTTDLTNNRAPSKFELTSQSYMPGCSYRLNVDVGRESGTWMDPRWGASGRRIEFTLEVSFPLPSVDEVSFASEDIAKGLLKSVTSKSNTVSQVYKMNHAPYARLKGGFDKMAILDGAYCIETSSTRSSSTLRFCLLVAGADEGMFGDISIPQGNLYFALPYFGTRSNESNGKSMALSTKEGTITVKQMGWHTGWRREESRILGLFRACPINRSS